MCYNNIRTFIESKGVSYVQIRIAYAHQRRQCLRCKLGRRYDKAVCKNRFFGCCCNKPFYKRQHLYFTFSAVGTAYYAIQQGAYTNGRKIAEELDFDLFFGIEEGYGNGKEFLAYGFEPEFLLSRPFLRNADLNIWAKEIHSVGGFIAYAHPFRDRDYITNPDEVPNISIVDGIEGYNRGNRDIENEKATRVFGNADTIITAGSDLHSTDFDSAYGIETQHRIRSNEELVKTLLERNFRVYLGE